MKNILASVPIFAGLDQGALELLLSEGEEYAFADKEAIFREGEPDDEVFVIEKGHVRICRNLGRPEEVELAVLNPRELFGETCLLETLSHTATAQAVGPTIIFNITGSTFNRLYREMPEQYGLLILNIARDLSRRLRQLDDRYMSGLRNARAAMAPEPAGSGKTLKT